MRSEMWPNSGIETNDTPEAISTAKKEGRETFNVDAVGEHEGSEDIERGLLRHSRQRAGHLLGLLLDHRKHRRALDLLSVTSFLEDRRFGEIPRAGCRGRPTKNWDFRLKSFYYGPGTAWSARMPATEKIDYRERASPDSRLFASRMRFPIGTAIANAPRMSLGAVARRTFAPPVPSRKLHPDELVVQAARTGFG